MQSGILAKSNYFLNIYLYYETWLFVWAEMVLKANNDGLFIVLSYMENSGLKQFLGDDDHAERKIKGEGGE